MPQSALDDAFRQVTRPESPNPTVNNHRFHRLLVEGVPVIHPADDGRTAYAHARLADFDDAAADRSAVEVMGDERLAFIAKELIQAVRKNVSIDWTLRRSARARIRIVVKRILRRYGYPPDLQEAATRTVLEQAELLAAEWAV